MEVIVPFSTERPKSRLSDVLGPDERAAFARAMLRDVVDAIDEAGGEPRVLATGPVAGDLDRPVTIDDRPLTTAVNAALDERLTGAGGTEAPDTNVSHSVAIAMADLALATPAVLRELLAAGSDADVAIAPGRGGGTNALVVSHPAFRVDYHGASYLDHRRIADGLGADVRVVDSHRLATDVDEPSDLAELLIHDEADEGTETRAARWLREAGFELDATGGRVGVVRE
ncbi:2-phospho-L-lactate guanylyltransferase [Halorubrum sp. DTA46]|uniref:2-phospho-L-lactate guanylyltransferase n=1 Tax=Halorubrum sp. DTA46 TaxID=3402162 RepID=UPI003AABD1ED